MHTFKIDDHRGFIEDIKSLVVLYCEIFGDIDPKTKKPSLDPEKIEELKRIVLEKRITEDEWLLLKAEFDRKWWVSMSTRWFLQSIKSEADNQGNVYHNKE
jgi:hypothetical protein